MTECLLTASVSCGDSRLLTQKIAGGLQRQEVTVWPKAGDLPYSNISKVRMASKRFPSMDIGQMDLNHRDVHRQDSISDSNARMCIRSRVDDEHIGLRTVLLQPIDEFAFMVRLQYLNGMPLALCKLTEHPINVHQQCLTIYLGLPLSQQIQVRSMYHKNTRHTCSSSRRRQILPQGNLARILSDLPLLSELFEPTFQLSHYLA
jgi:hypothetical protein